MWLTAVIVAGGSGGGGGSLFALPADFGPDTDPPQPASNRHTRRTAPGRNGLDIPLPPTLRETVDSWVENGRQRAGTGEIFLFAASLDAEETQAYESHLPGSSGSQFSFRGLADNPIEIEQWPLLKLQKETAPSPGSAALF